MCSFDWGSDPIKNRKCGDSFHQETKYYRNRFGDGPDWSLQPDRYKTYPENQTIQLSNPKQLKTVSMLNVLEKRRSIRQFSQQSLSQEKLSFLLWASTGIQRRDHGFLFRTAPSAGALYPIETYVMVHMVNTISPGVYHYNIKDHSLELLKKGDVRRDITKALLDQPMCSQASVVFVWTAIFDRSKCKYGQRGYRYIYLDAGHIAENLALAATSIDLGSCQIAALYDDEVNQLVDVDGIRESVIYASVVGQPVGV